MRYIHITHLLQSRMLRFLLQLFHRLIVLCKHLFSSSQLPSDVTQFFRHFRFSPLRLLELRAQVVLFLLRLKKYVTSLSD